MQHATLLLMCDTIWRHFCCQCLKRWQQLELRKLGNNKHCVEYISRTFWASFFHSATVKKFCHWRGEIMGSGFVRRAFFRKLFNFQSLPKVYWVFTQNRKLTKRTNNIEKHTLWRNTLLKLKKQNFRKTNGKSLCTTGVHHRLKTIFATTNQNFCERKSAIIHN